MRVAPTAIDTAAMALFQADRGNTGTVATPTTITLDSTTNTKIAVAAYNKSASFTANQWYRVTGNNSTSAFIGFSAEL